MAAERSHRKEGDLHILQKGDLPVFDGGVHEKCLNITFKTLNKHCYSPLSAL